MNRELNFSFFFFFFCRVAIWTQWQGLGGSHLGWLFPRPRSPCKGEQVTRGSLSCLFSMWPMAAEHRASSRHLWAPLGWLSSRALMFIKVAYSLKQRTQHPATSRTRYPLWKDNQVTAGTDSAGQVVLSRVWRCRKSPGSPNARRGSPKLGESLLFH